MISSSGKIILSQPSAEPVELVLVERPNRGLHRSAGRQCEIVDETSSVCEDRRSVVPDGSIEESAKIARFRLGLLVWRRADNKALENVRRHVIDGLLNVVYAAIPGVAPDHVVVVGAIKFDELRFERLVLFFASPLGC